jgi:hypothetical protein
MGEGARGLAGARGSVDPALVEEATGDLGHAGREGRIGGQNRLPRLVPGDGALLDPWQGRVAVPMIELVLAEPLGLQSIIAMGQPRVGLADGGDQRLHHLALNPVGEMARIRHVLEAAPAVGDLLVLGEGVRDEREGAKIGLEGLGQGVGGIPAQGLVRVLKLVEGRLDGQLLAAHGEAQGGDGLVEQAVPGGAPGHGLLVEELLDLVVELVGLVLAQVLDPGPVMGERLLAHGPVHDLVFDAVELEPEEQKLA